MTKRQNLDLNNLIPSTLKNETLSSLVSNLFNRFLSEEQSIFLDGRVGKSVDGEPQIEHDTLERSINTLVPAINFSTGTETSIFTFDDLKNRLDAIGVNTANMHAWMAEQSFNYSMPISYDKLINFSNYFWVGGQQTTVPAPSWNSSLAPEYYVMQAPAVSTGLNDWQLYNFWVHRDDLDGAGWNISESVQATRPIIEYVSGLQLNSSIDARGNPNDITPGSYIQRKTRFNQIPQFDLFRYDDTHAGSTSGIFFYQEDPDFTVDAVLKRRVKTTVDSDYIFSIGNLDESGRLLYYRVDGQLLSTWRPGPSSPLVVNKKFSGGGGKSEELLAITPAALADNQQWTLTATSSTKFQITGTESGSVGTATVGISFQCDDFTILISPGLEAFMTGDSFSFDIFSSVAPRYVKKLDSGDTVNYPGGASSDVVGEGAWVSPIRLVQNLERETRLEISYGDIIGHVRSILAAQEGFQGVSFGSNNSRNIEFNSGYGGTIKEFSSNFPLLVSMLMQRDVSPLTILDFAEFQYNAAISSIDQFLINGLADYLANNSAIILSAINPYSQDVLDLLDAFETVRANDENLKTVFSDSSSPVKNWPMTAPQAGLGAAHQPGVAFDNELGIYTIVHHDGHISPIFERDEQFDSMLTRSAVTRSDGTVVAGVISSIAPSQPYARQLWINNSTFDLKIFNVSYDSDNPSTGKLGDFWYKRSTDELYEWNDSAKVWAISALSKVDRWTTIDTATIRNSLLLAIENKLYRGVHPSQELSIDVSAVADSEIEFSKFSAKYQYDRYAPAYDATDAFSWNYSRATVPGLPTVPARWFNIYKHYFDIPGLSLPTSRPNLEPWKLLGYDTEPSSWASTWPTAMDMWHYIRAVRSYYFGDRAKNSTLTFSDPDTDKGNISVTLRSEPVILEKTVNAGVIERDISNTNLEYISYSELIALASTGDEEDSIDLSLASDIQLFEDSISIFNNGQLIAPAPINYQFLWDTKKILIRNNAHGAGLPRPFSNITVIFSPPITAKLSDFSELPEDIGLINADSVSIFDQGALNSLAANQVDTTENIDQPLESRIRFKNVFSPENSQDISKTYKIIFAPPIKDQTWTITATSPTKFSVTGTESGLVGEATVGTTFMCDSFTADISSGVTAFDIGDIFSFKTAPLKTCTRIDSNSDVLLIPPYVSPLSPNSAEALLNSEPVGKSAGYTFGDDGPIEIVWKKSLEYRYGQLRSYFKEFPLEFLDSGWGETYVTAGDNLRVERNLMTSLPAKKFLLHGERLNIINKYSPEEVEKRFSFYNSTLPPAPPPTGPTPPAPTPTPF